MTNPLDHPLWEPLRVILTDLRIVSDLGSPITGWPISILHNWTALPGRPPKPLYRMSLRLANLAYSPTLKPSHLMIQVYPDNFHDVLDFYQRLDAWTKRRRRLTATP